LTRLVKQVKPVIKVGERMLSKSQIVLPLDLFFSLEPNTLGESGPDQDG
jgi:hypothetical protein